MTLSIENITWRGEFILVGDMEFGARKTTGGILIRDDDMKVEGARPRMARVVAIGPKVKDVNVGQYVVVEHGRWTRGWKMLENGKEITVRMIDNNDILLVTDQPSTEYLLAEKR